jgi:hypothetical protein
MSGEGFPVSLQTGEWFGEIKPGSFATLRMTVNSKPSRAKQACAELRLRLHGMGLAFAADYTG